MKHSEIEVQNVWYSNDGESDLITLTVDNKMLGKVLTETLNKHGAGWNILKPSGTLGFIIYLSEGRHQLSLYIEKGDEYGVEIDKIELFLHNGKEEHSLDCKVFCFDDISYDHGIADTGFGLYHQKAN
ncbi:hypothetical protein ACJMK2_034797 [Sinanodonta woodiana]|uniref:Uncharacterized protein n=1 Tax=Sinanodonta woodiana TaxID=1069815 RepID=A0ABD3WST0_SINWO